MTEYQGWANRETWCIALHLSNDPAMYAGARQIAMDPHFDSDHMQQDAMTDYALAVLTGADETPSFLNDYLQASLQSVDWESVVDRFRDDY